MSPKPKKAFELRECPPHTAAKHALLRRYLGAWFPIIARWNKRVVYYDAFAGPGEYLGGSPGSPIIALQTLIDHSAFTAMSATEFVFLFNEQDGGCANHLGEQVAAFQAAHQPWPANVNIDINNSTFIDLTTEILDDIDKREAKLAPIFAFVDPVGVKATPMAILKRLTDFPKAEMLVYFANEASVRWSGSGQIDKALKDLFGTDEFKGVATLAPGESAHFVHDLYKQRLHDECNFPYIQSFTMYDDRGKRVYDLFYCTREPIGMSRMKEAMWKVAPSGDYTFRDRFANQEVIFAELVDAEPLRRHLMEYFRGQAVTIETVIAHVIVATPYLETHVKTKTLKPMQVAGQISSPNQNRPGTFPKGTIIQFSA
ncbi:three-Cys-motif partner protein TcmP [Mycobacterium sp. CVI_P3]|uniref:Three-Cys-motif partner protein TcmP n=1 Tax=Mycobacterium pinniadriaticum TaxID=2994102 RepID=A0ABT3SNP7_9MYCO|nr:three-Cys-motif partner protein TcmP [Mycobacterium pinniadriaticum]MCX2934713.1 three-Cys-motif partner protein TcmP [Mycobacterium pinniadriaticum]MCX2941135.1 three-Cys-motif partner protein TcmP [Mycobacterium pinniadriaticum]